MLRLSVPPATPTISSRFDSSPSLTPKTPARSAPPAAARWRPSERAICSPFPPPPRAATARPWAISSADMVSGASATSRYLAASAASSRSTRGRTLSAPNRWAMTDSTRVRSVGFAGRKSVTPASRSSRSQCPA